MKVLVINCGSSSLKYQLIDMEKEQVLTKGLVERIGLDGSTLTQKSPDKAKYVVMQPMDNHKVAIKLVLDALTGPSTGVIKSLNEISAVGHRVVHGGEKYAQSVLIDDEVMSSLEECVKLAPLHNPPNIIGINVCRELMPGTPMVAVFDTAFHQTMPEEAYMYALPYEYYTKFGIRKYGFHGTSHKYVANKAAEAMGTDIKNLKIITCHLGNGASVAAIKNGECVDTSMGFTPLAGLAMGTRSGDLDPAILPFLAKELSITVDEVLNILNKESGVLGVSGVSSDFRDIMAAADKGNKRASLALALFNYRVKKYIGAYAASMGGLDCIVFTAGLGENSPETRENICTDLEFLGVEFDISRNNVRGQLTEISSDDSKVKVYVIPTDEEMMIAKETQEVIKEL